MTYLPCQYNGEFKSIAVDCESDYWTDERQDAATHILSGNGRSPSAHKHTVRIGCYRHRIAVEYSTTFGVLAALDREVAAWSQDELFVPANRDKEVQHEILH